MSTHNASRDDRIRKTFVMKVKAGKEAQYQASHDAIWPEMSSMLKEHGVHNYSISLLPETRQLFAYVEVLLFWHLRQRAKLD
jgi:L-rhamnose mutarotase